MRGKAGLLLAAILLGIGVFAGTVGLGAQRSENEGFAPQRGLPEMNLPMDYLPGELLVKFTHGAPPDALERAQRQLGARHLRTFRFIGVQHWRLGQGVSVERALEILAQPAFRSHIEFAEPNYLYHAFNLPNDPLRGDLYGLHNLGQTGGTKDADIDALEAWSKSTGSASVIVGVIDTGIDYNHPDLAANIWTNSGEIPGNGLDDDGNGYVDDVHGWNAVSNSGDPFDDNGHGTHVAGTIGATGNNGTGVVGVNWNVKLMALKFLNGAGTGSNTDAIEAIEYAASWGVPITSNILGGGQRSKALESAIKNSGALFVAAAGNGGTSSKQYPAGYALDNIIAVAATDHNDQLAGFSNFGTWVHLAAPGVSILSTLPGNRYGLFSGTSMATPHVSGVAALVLADSPGMPTLGLKTQLLSNVDALASLSGKVTTGGRLNAARALGVTPDGSSDVVAPNAVTTLAAGTVTRDSIAFSWSASGDDGSTGTAYLYDVRYSTAPIDDSNWTAATPATGEPAPQSAGSIEAFTLTGLLPSTTYYVALRVVDEAGNTSVLSNVVSATTDASPWLVEIVPDGNSIGFYNSLAFGPAGPGLAYSAPNDIVRFAQKSGGSWSFSTVGTSATGIDVAFDPNDGNPSVSFGWGKLNFADWNGSSWLVQTVEKSNAYNDYTGLQYDAAGNPGICYRTTGRNGGLKFARRVGGVWSLEMVEKGAGARYNALTYDPSGNPAIAYSHDFDGDNWLDSARLARWNGSAWEIEEVERGPVGYGVFVSVAFDSSGRPCVAHGNGTIRFGCKQADGTWAMENVDAGRTESLAFDPATGEALISYSGAEGLRFARRTASGWQAELIDPGSSSFRTDLAVDSSGKPAVGASSDLTGQLRLARKTSP